MQKFAGDGKDRIARGCPTRDDLPVKMLSTANRGCFRRRRDFFEL